ILRKYILYPTEVRGYSMPEIYLGRYCVHTYLLLLPSLYSLFLLAFITIQRRLISPPFSENIYLSKNSISCNFCSYKKGFLTLLINGSIVHLVESKLFLYLKLLVQRNKVNYYSLNSLSLFKHHKKTPKQLCLGVKFHIPK
ncbi:hypothetical protein, partial [Myroides odoratimimus]|uniref:hypothetical protein n=1 Tax=Myroides odoratimimus TaxID=76832 RepID=UPI00257774CD